MVSKGPKLKVTTVPNILSSNKTTAEKLLQQAGLTAEYLGEDYSDNYPKGQVFTSLSVQEPRWKRELPFSIW